MVNTIFSKDKIPQKESIVWMYSEYLITRDGIVKPLKSYNGVKGVSNNKRSDKQLPLKMVVDEEVLL